MSYLSNLHEQIAVAPLAIAAIAQGAYGLYRGLKADAALNELEKRRQARFMDAAGPIQENKRIAERIAQQGLTPQTRALMENQYASSRASAYRAASDLSGGQMSNALSRLGAMNNINFALNLGAQNEAAQRQGQQMLMGTNRELSGLQRADVAQDISDLQTQKKGYGLASQQGKMDVLGAIGGWAMGNLGKDIPLFGKTPAKSTSPIDVSGALKGVASGALAGMTGSAAAPAGTITTDAASFAPSTSPYNFGAPSLSTEAMSALDNATQNALRKPLTTTDVGQITAPPNLGDKIQIPMVSRENRVAPGAVGPETADIAKVGGEIDLNQYNQPAAPQAQAPQDDSEYINSLFSGDYTAKAGLGLPATALPQSNIDAREPMGVGAQSTDMAKVFPQDFQQQQVQEEEPQEDVYASVNQLIVNAGKSAAAKRQPSASTEDYRNMLMEQNNLMGTPAYQFYNRTPMGQGPVQPNMFVPQQPTSYIPFGQYPNMFTSPQSMFSPIGPQSFMTPSQGYVPQGNVTPMNTVPYNRANIGLGARIPSFMGRYQAVMTDQGIQYIPR